MKRNLVLPRPSTLLVAATAALMAGVVATPYLATPVLAQEKPRLPAPAPEQQTVPDQPRAPAQGPASVADLAEGLLGAVVNISTSQTVKGGGEGAVPLPQLPEGSPFQDFFDDFFKDRRGNTPGGGPQKVQSLGSGFVVDAEKLRLHR